MHIRTPSIQIENHPLAMADIQFKCQFCGRMFYCKPSEALIYCDGCINVGIGGGQEQPAFVNREGPRRQPIRENETYQSFSPGELFNLLLNQVINQIEAEHERHVRALHEMSKTLHDWVELKWLFAKVFRWSSNLTMQWCEIMRSYRDCTRDPRPVIAFLWHLGQIFEESVVAPRAPQSDSSAGSSTTQQSESNFRMLVLEEKLIPQPLRTRFRDDGDQYAFPVAAFAADRARDIPGQLPNFRWLSEQATSVLKPPFAAAPPHAGRDAPQSPKEMKG